MLASDEDTDAPHHISLLRRFRGLCPQCAWAATDATIERLGKIIETPRGTWNRDERKYYDARDRPIESPSQSIFRLAAGRPDWSRVLIREAAIFQPIRSAVRHQCLVEVGCGSAKAAAFSINPTDYEYDYIGVEPSWQRLLHARAILPSGNFIQGSALNLPIQSAQARAILAFGALHHMPDPLVALREMIRVLSDGGYLGFHEPIRTPKILSATSKMAARIKRAFETYEHSEHDNDIDYMKVRKLLKENGFEILNEVFCNSIFGYLLQRAVRRVPLIGRARATAWAIQQLDHGWVKTIGAISERFGARAVVHLSQAR